MPIENITSTLQCTQCGAELHPDEGQVFLTCPSCGSTIFLDTTRVVLHYAVAPTLAEEQAGAALRRWMSGSATVKDLDRKAEIGAPSFAYFPLWYIKEQSSTGAETERVQPAAATALTELARIKLPAGDLQPYDAALDATSEPPSVPLETALAWTGPAPVSAPNRLPGEVANPGVTRREASLVHVPLYTFPYRFRGQEYTAVVDAAAGAVMASRYPAKPERPYVVVGLVAALVYLCLALIPIFSGLGSTTSGTFPVGMIICTAGGIVAAPILFLWAFRVASSV